MRQPYTAMIVARAFPPEGTVAVHRVIGLCRHLAASGRWRVTVVTAAPPSGAAVDEEPLADVPRSVRVVRAAAPELPLLAARLFKGRKAAERKRTECPAPGPGDQPGLTQPRRAFRYAVDWTSWWLQLPDSQTGWLLPAVWAGLRAARREPPDVIFSTAPIWTAHVAGAVLSTLLRAPLVTDFRDPWTGSTFRRVPYAAHRWLNAWLERRVVARAARITCAWDGIRQYMADRYPERADRMRTVWNGFDPATVDASPERRLNVPGLVFLHAGGFYGPRSPLPLLEAIGGLEPRGPDLHGPVTFVLVGPGSYNGQPIDELVAQYGLANQVRVLPQVPYREAISLIKGADATMLFGQSGSKSLASIPAKAYEYIGLRKPVLAIGAGSEVCEVLRRGGCPLWCAPAEAPAAIAVAIERMLRFVRCSRPFSASICEREHFTRDRMAREIESVMLEVGAMGRRDR